MKRHKIRIVTIIAAGVLFLPYILFVTVYHIHSDMLTESLEYQPNLPTIVYDTNGRVITKLYDEMRQPVPFNKIPQSVIDAFTTAEDKNFFTHNGLDYTGMLRALLVDIRHGSIVQGGSTITQQLIKQLYTHKRRTIERKIIEILMVGRIEREFTKKQILEMYLNQIYFGHGVYGINAAAAFFFNKKLENLTIYEASLLALIPPAPNRYSPLKNPQLTYSKHRRILLSLVKNGHLRRDTARSGFEAFWDRYLDNLAKRSPNEIARSSNEDRAPYASDHIRELLIEKFGKDAVYRGGLTVHTTIDLQMQDTARKHLVAQIARQQRIAARYNTRLIRNNAAAPILNTVPAKDRNRAAALLKSIEQELLDSTEALALLTGADPAADIFQNHRRFVRHQYQQAQVEGAFVALEHDSGAVRVIVGGTKFEYDNQLNRAVETRRQPGSAFKPFVYATGIERKKITAATRFQDLPIVSIERDEIWAPANASEKFSGDVLVREAITRSINIIAVLAYEKIGGHAIAQQAARMIGISPERFTVDPTLALGSSELTPLELATGFAAIANSGMKVSPHFIEKVVDNEGTVLYEHTGESQKRVLSRQTAYIMISFLRNVVTGGTATSTIRRRYGYYDPCAGKTGTNTEYRDAWFAGFTPDMTAAAWIGCDSQQYTLGPGQYGAVAAAPVWAQFMKETKQFRRKSSFPGRPQGVVSKRICSHSGELPRPDCPKTRELFIRGTEPDTQCTSSHREMQSIESLLRGDEE